MEHKRKAILEYVQRTKLIETCVSHQCRRYYQMDYKNDLIQDLYVWLLTYDIHKLYNAYSNNHLNALITAVLQRNLYSRTSPFYRTYKKFQALTNSIENYTNSLNDED